MHFSICVICSVPEKELSSQCFVSLKKIFSRKIWSCHYSCQCFASDALVRHFQNYIQVTHMIKISEPKLLTSILILHIYSLHIRLSLIISLANSAISSEESSKCSLQTFSIVLESMSKSVSNSNSSRLMPKSLKESRSV